MKLSEVHSLLAQHNALIVHCAGMTKGIGNTATASLDYLERLEHAAQNQVELSCSTVVPNDECSFERMNYTGKVGLVLRPSTAESITFASATDAGSQIDPTRPGRRIHNCGPVSLQAIETAISCRHPDKYNEIGMFKLSVACVFVDPPIQYSSDEGFHDVSVDEVATRFRDQDLFCLRRGVLHCLYKQDDSWHLGQRVAVASIYNDTAYQ